jgi:molecular chaperone GrpE
MPFQPEQRPELSDAERPEETSDEPLQESELDATRRERDEYLASWQRAQADYQNLRRRMAQDIEAATRRAKQPLLSDVLLVLDQLEMALAVPAEHEDARNLRIGVELTRGELLRALENEGVRPVPEGGAFDPAVHQALRTVAAPEAEPGSIVKTVRRGYTWGDQVLRFAQVEVAGDADAGDA